SANQPANQRAITDVSRLRPHRCTIIASSPPAEIAASQGDSPPGLTRDIRATSGERRRNWFDFSGRCSRMSLRSCGLLGALLLRLVEILQVRCGLALLRGHQQPVGAEEVALLADLDVLVADAADVLEPEWFLLQRIGLVHRPWPGQRMIDGSDLIVHDLGV